MGELFNGLLENSINTGIKTNIKDAIEDVGGKVPASAGLWEYPDIIRNSLVASTISSINLKAHDIINIYKTSEGDDILHYNISTKYDTLNVERPNYAKDNSNWNKQLSVDKVFDDLFGNILPNVRGIHAGDVVATDNEGKEMKGWINTLFNSSGVKSGLTPNSTYLRLYLTCQAEPLYIFMNNSIRDLTKGYNVVDSDTVAFTIDADNMNISANIECITNEQLNSIK